MDINKVYLTGTVNSVTCKAQRNSFKLIFSIKTEDGKADYQKNISDLGKSPSAEPSLYADYHEVYLFYSNDETEQKRLSQIVRCGNRVSVFGQLRNFRITDSLGKVAVTSKVIAYKIRLGAQATNFKITRKSK